MRGRGLTPTVDRDEPIRAAPDYFTTLLFRKVTASTVLHTTSTSAAVRVYAYCSREHVGGVAVTMVNLDETTTATASIPVRHPCTVNTHIPVPPSCNNGMVIRSAYRVYGST